MDTITLPNQSAGPVRQPRGGGASAATFTTRQVCFLSILLLVGFGAVYRLVASRLEGLTGKPVQLPLKLETIPSTIGLWRGEDHALDAKVQEIAGTDDYLNRLYTNVQTDESAFVYVAYTGRPRTMLGHRPQVCMPGAGWVHDSTERSVMVSRSGKEVPCLLHRFHWPSGDRSERVVLNFYVVNGQLTDDESVFSGMGWRTPNIAGDPARYVAQVQVSSHLETCVRSVGRDLTDIILDYLPDEDGQVRAAALDSPLADDTVNSPALEEPAERWP